MFSTAIRTAALVAMTFSIPTLALSQERGTKEDAKAMVEAALVHIKKVGPEKAYKDFTDKSNPDWQKKDIYVFVYTLDNVGLAQGGNAKFIGQNLSDYKDQNGKLFIQEFAKVVKSQGSGWVDYDWTHPITKKIESKVTYVKKVDGIEAYAGAGAYGQK